MITPVKILGGIIMLNFLKKLFQKKTISADRPQKPIAKSDLPKAQPALSSKSKEEKPTLTKTAPETTPPVDPEAAHENVLSDTKTEDKAPRGKYSVKTANDNTFMFNLKAVNGEIIATSQTYTSKASCLNGIKSVKNNAPVASIEDQTLPEFVPASHPKFELYSDKGGAFRFRLKATNGNIIAASQGYTSKSKCQDGIESVRQNALSEIVFEENKTKNS